MTNNKKITNDKFQISKKTEITISKVPNDWAKANRLVLQIYLGQ